MSIWDKTTTEELKNAKSSGSGVYLKEGNYTIEVNRCVEIETYGDKKKAFIAEMKVLTSDNPACPVGYQPSLYIQENPKFEQMWKGHMMDFINPALEQLGKDHKMEATPEFTVEIGRKITGEENILAGVKLTVYAFDKLSKTGKTITNYRWSTHS